MSRWKLEAYDSFARESYSLPGEYESQDAAEKAAEERLRHIDVVQPAATSKELQDRVYVVRQDGTAYLYDPPTRL
jgi:hypothetical protein